MRSGGSEQVHPTQVVAPRSFRRMYGEPPQPSHHMRHHHHHHHTASTIEHRNASDGEEGGPIGPDDVSETGSGVILGDEQGVEVILNVDQTDEIVNVAPRPELPGANNNSTNNNNSNNNSDQNLYRSSSTGSPHPQQYGGYASSRGAHYDHQPHPSAATASGHRSHEIPYPTARSRSFEANSGPSASGGAEDRNTSTYPPPPMSTHSHYSPQVTYPGPRSGSSASNSNGNNYSSDDVNVISPSHKPDYNRPPPHHHVSSSPSPAAYQYPPASPVRREAAGTSSAPYHHRHHVHRPPVMSRREHQRYAASSSSSPSVTSTPNPRHHHHHHRTHREQSFHPDDGTFNVYSEPASGPVPQPTTGVENYVSPQPHYPSAGGGASSGISEPPTTITTTAPLPPGGSNNYVSPHPSYPSPRRRHRPPTPPSSHHSHHHQASLPPSSHYESTDRHYSATPGHHDSYEPAPPPHFDDYRYYGGSSTTGHHHRDTSPYPSHYGGHAAGAPPPHRDSSPYPSHYGSSSSVHQRGGYHHPHTGARPTLQSHHSHYDRHQYEEEPAGSGYYPPSSHHPHHVSSSSHHHHPGTASVYGPPPSPPGAHHQPYPHHPHQGYHQPYPHHSSPHPHHPPPPPKIKNGILLPDAAQEIDFEVTCPPLEPSMPPSEHPICSGPSELNTHDVLCGRGGGTNSQIGNRRFRKLVQEFQPTYLLARRKEKPLLARTIVLIIRKRGGRFLKKDEETGELMEVGDAKAEAKTSQALREGLDVRATKANAATLMEKKKKTPPTTSVGKVGLTSSSPVDTTDAAPSVPGTPTKVSSGSADILGTTNSTTDQDPTAKEGGSTIAKEETNEQDKPESSTKTADPSGSSENETDETEPVTNDADKQEKEDSAPLSSPTSSPEVRAKTPPRQLEEENTAMETPPPSPPPSLPKLVGGIHPHSPEALQFRKRRRMRSGEGGCLGGVGGSTTLLDDKLFPDFCPPRADLGRTGSPTLASMLDQDEDDHHLHHSQHQYHHSGSGGRHRHHHRHHSMGMASPTEDDGYIQGRGGCAGIAMGLLTGGGFCLGPSNWSRRSGGGGKNQ